MQWSIFPFATNPSTPIPGPFASSLAMKTHVYVVSNTGFISPNCAKMVVINAT